MVRPLESIADTQPQLPPALLRLSVALLIVENDLRDSFIDLKLSAHGLDLRWLLYELRCGNYDTFPQGMN
jgi:hypothetical protein